jgi:hypothetical protein
MNDRIKELMPKPWTFPYPDRELYTKEQLEKFAELLLSRVMSICEDLGDQGMDGHYCVDKIRREFGL